MEETVSLSTSPPSTSSSSTTFSSSSPTAVAAEVASVHRCTRGQARTPPVALPQLPLRLSHARPQASSSPTTGLIFFGRSLSRTTDGVRSKPNRGDPNDYVDDPATPERVRNPVHPVPSSTESRSISRTDSGDDSKSSDTNFSKDKTPPPPQTGSIQGPTFSCKESIICPRCRLCRCTKCAGPRPLPPLHCCRSTTPCLPEELAVCLSCLWCPRAAYARCVPDATDESQFCSCEGPSAECCARWTCLAAVVPCLPCLCLYWPLRWTLAACSACHNCKRRGCRCGGPEQLASLEALLIVDEEPLSSNSNASRD